MVDTPVTPAATDVAPAGGIPPLQATTDAEVLSVDEIGGINGVREAPTTVQIDVRDGATRPLALPTRPGSSSQPKPRDPTTRSIRIVLASPRSKAGSDLSRAGRLLNGHERRSTDRIKRLSREFDAVCTSAVDAAEIAAALESGGFTDSTAKEYGFADVFALAELLFQQTPRLVNHRPGRLVSPWVERPLKHFTRGVSFALPGLIFIACLPQVTATVEFLALTVAMLTGWPIGQTMAFLGYALEGRHHPMAARAILSLGLAASLVVGLLYAALAVRLGVTPSVAMLGAGEITYMAGASVVLVLSSEWIVLGSLVPGLAAAFLTWRGIGSPGYLLAVGALGTVLSSVISAFATTAKARWRDLRIAFACLILQSRFLSE
jgi:hypothetical protein